MKSKNLTRLLAVAALLVASATSQATNTTCPPGQVEKEVNGHWKCVDEEPLGNSGNSTNTNTNTNTANATGGNSNSNATGGTVRDSGNSSSSSGAVSLSGVSGSGNSNLRNTNNLNNQTRIGDVGSNSSSSVGNTSASIGDTSLSNGSSSTSNASNGDQTLNNANSASADGSGNSSVAVDASDRSSNSYTSQALVLPEVQTAAPAIVASPTVTIVPGTCSIRVKRIVERARGTYVGLVKRSTIDLGNDDIAVEPELEFFKYHEDRNGNLLVEGSRVDYAVFAVGAAASRSIGVNGGETGGGYGGAGMSSGSSIQRPIVRALITPCLMPPLPPLPPRTVLVETQPKPESR